MTFDELIAQSLRDTLEEKCAENRVDGKDHRFSVAYKIRRRSIIRSYWKSAPLSIRKIRYILLAVILAVFALTGFSLWRQFGPFSFNVFKDHSKVYYGGDDVKTSIEEIYGLPEEYELLSIVTSDFNVYSKYLFDEKVVILYQYLISDINHTNTENNNAEYLSINGNDGYFITVEDENYLVWIMEDYQFYLLGKIDKNAAVLLAESLKVKNFDKIP